MPSKNLASSITLTFSHQDVTSNDSELSIHIGLNFAFSWKEVNRIHYR